MRHARLARTLILLTLLFLPLLGVAAQPAPAPVAAASPCDSLCARDSLAVVRSLWKVKGPGKVWLVVPLFVAVGALDRDGGGYRDAYTGGVQPQDRILAPDKRDHLYVGGVTALLLDERTFAWRGAAWSCAAGWAFELGQMRPAGFPKAVQGDRLGYGSARDAAMNCTGAVVFPAARALVRKVRS